MVPVYVVIFLSGLSFSAVVPFLVFLVTKDGGNPFVLGVIGASFWAAQFVGASWLGPLSDRIGRKRVLLRSQLGAVSAWGVFLIATLLRPHELLHFNSTITGAFVVTLPLILVVASRLLEGLLDSTVSITNAYVSDLMRETRKVGFARLSIAANLGFILGPFVAGVLATDRGIVPVAALAVIASVIGATACLALREVPLCHETPDAVLSNAAPLKMFTGPCREAVRQPPGGLVKATLEIPALRPLFAIYFAVYFGFSIFTSALPIHAAHDLMWSGERLGTLFSTLALSLVLTQWVLLPWVASWFSDATLGLFGSLLTLGSYVAMSRSSSLALFAGCIAYGVGNGLAWPSFLALLSRTAPEDLQGSAQGVGASVSSIASVAGTLLSGILFEAIGPATFYVAASSLAIAAALFAHNRSVNSHSRRACTSSSVSDR